MPRCSVVIRAHNEEKHIGRLLSGLLRQTISDLEIVLVDSGSSDATVAIASRYPVRVLHLPKHEFTFGRSLNFGIENSASEYIVVASAHVYPIYDNWLELLLAPFADPRIALVYGKQRGNEVTRYSEHRVFERWFPNKSTEHQTHPFCNNANAALRREIWRSLPYDETLTGLEDVEWAHRASARGHGISYAADAVVAHVHEEPLGRIYNRYYREALALKRILPDEHFNLRDFVKLFGGNVMSDGFHAAREGRMLREAPGIVGFRLMQFWGTYRGFAQRAPVTSALKEKFYYPTTIAPPPPDSSGGRRIDYSGSEPGQAERSYKVQRGRA